MRCFILTSILLVTWTENVAGVKCSFVVFLFKPCSCYWIMVGWFRSLINIETISLSERNGSYFHEDYNAQFWFWLCWREMLLHLYCQCCWSVMRFMEVFELSRVSCAVLKGVDRLLQNYLQKWRSLNSTAPQTAADTMLDIITFAITGLMYLLAMAAKNS